MNNGTVYLTENPSINFLGGRSRNTIAIAVAVLIGFVLIWLYSRSIPSESTGTNKSKNKKSKNKKSKKCSYWNDNNKKCNTGHTYDSNKADKKVSKDQYKNKCCKKSSSGQSSSGQSSDSSGNNEKTCSYWKDNNKSCNSRSIYDSSKASNQVNQDEFQTNCCKDEPRDNSPLSTPCAKPTNGIWNPSHTPPPTWKNNIPSAYIQCDGSYELMPFPTSYDCTSGHLNKDACKPTPLCPSGRTPSPGSNYCKKLSGQCITTNNKSIGAHIRRYATELNGCENMCTMYDNICHGYQWSHSSEDAPRGLCQVFGKFSDEIVNNINSNLPTTGLQRLWINDGGPDVESIYTGNNDPKYRCVAKVGRNGLFT